MATKRKCRFKVMDRVVDVTKGGRRPIRSVADTPDERGYLARAKKINPFVSATFANETMMLFKKKFGKSESPYELVFWDDFMSAKKK